MKLAVATAVLALGVGVVFNPLPVHAQAATTLEQAEMAGLSPDVRAEVQKRMAAPGQTVSEILTTMLLNNIKLKHPASRIVAMDFGRGTAVVQTAEGSMATVDFDTTTLQPKS